MPRALQSLRAELRQEFREPDSFLVNTLSNAVALQIRPWTTSALVFTFFGALAMLVATIGLYGTIRYAVARRAREFGIRISLGAQRRHLAMIVGRRELLPVIVGLVVAVVASIAGGRFLQSLLYRVPATDPLVLASVVITMSLIAIVACLIPVVHTARTAPVAVMRAE
jgi:ABC-type antimicrobial peptide transport system permease subunit